MDTLTGDRDYLLNAVLNAWDRNNLVLVNLLRALPPGGLDARAAGGSPTVAEMFTHMHHERMVSVLEEAPESAGPVPDTEWLAEPDPILIERMLIDSAGVVRTAVRSRIEARRELDRNFGNPALLVAFLIFHEGYHHGQIKLALKATGQPLGDTEAGPITWHVWRQRTADGA